MMMMMISGVGGVIHYANKLVANLKMLNHQVDPLDPLILLNSKTTHYILKYQNDTEWRFDKLSLNIQCYTDTSFLLESGVLYT